MRKIARVRIAEMWYIADWLILLDLAVDTSF